MKKIKWLEQLTNKGRLEELQRSSRRKESLGETYKVLIWGNAREGFILYSVVDSDRTRGRGQKMKARQRKQLFFIYLTDQLISVRMTKHWCRLSREAMETSSLEGFKIQLKAVLGTTVLGWRTTVLGCSRPCFEWGWLDWCSPEVSSTSGFLWFCTGEGEANLSLCE